MAATFTPFPKYVKLGTARGRTNHACHYLRDVLDVVVDQPAVRPTRPGQQPLQTTRPGGLPLLQPPLRSGRTGIQPAQQQQMAGRSGQQLTGGGEAIHQLLLSRLDKKMATLMSDQVS